MTGSSARHVYELRIGGRTRGEQRGDAAATIIGNALWMGTGGVGGDIVVGKVDIRVIERASGRVVVSMREPDWSAHTLAKMIATDLDALDADAFAAEWGIRTREVALEHRAMPGDAPAHGWYPEPNGEAGLRYWDGTDWTSLRHDGGVAWRDDYRRSGPSNPPPSGEPT